MENCNIILKNIEIYFLLWMFFSVVGWCIEVILGLIEQNKFVNRGFLIGPYCPIYGTGMVLLSLILNRYINDIFALLILSAVICGLLEYFTSFFMEKLFNARWWDYSKRFGNINGRVCISNLFFFSIFGTMIVKYINPFLLSKFNTIPEIILHILVTFLGVAILTDAIVSFKIVLGFRKITLELKDNTEELVAMVKNSTAEMKNALKSKEEELQNVIRLAKEQLNNSFREIIQGKSKLYRRLLNAFPDITTKKRTNKE